AEDHRAKARVVADELERDEVVHVRLLGVGEVSGPQVFLVQQGAVERLHDALLLELGPRSVERQQRIGVRLLEGVALELRELPGQAVRRREARERRGAPDFACEARIGAVASPALMRMSIDPTTASYEPVCATIASKSARASSKRRSAARRYALPVMTRR